MNRSAGVTVVAILSLIGSALIILMAGFIVLIAVITSMAVTPEQSDFPAPPAFVKFIFLFAALILLLSATWGIISSIGLFRLKNWARISTIVFSILLIIMGGFGLLIALIMPDPAVSNNPMISPAMVIQRIFMVAFNLMHLGVGIWWLVYFFRPKVVLQFRRAPLTETAGTSLPLVQPMQVSTGAETPVNVCRRPVSITVIAWFMLAGCLCMPLCFVLHMPAVLFTRILTGWPATLMYLIYTALSLCIAIGLLRLKPAARFFAIVYYIFGIVNPAVFCGAPGSGVRIRALMDMNQSMFPWMPALAAQPSIQFDPAPFFYMGMIGGLIPVAFVLYFLITRRKAFQTAADSL
jgi:uncharacterized membrane protein (DUF2068 family)